MAVNLRRKVRTVLKICKNPDEFRRFIIARAPSVSPTSYWLRLLYPAWWKYVFYVLTSYVASNNNNELNVHPANRFILRVPTAAGIGDQVVTSWSETYMLAREYGLKFVHYPFAKSPHDPNANWDEFLGFGEGEIQAQQVLKNEAIKTVWLPPISLLDKKNIRLIGRIINDVYPQDEVLFHLASNIYFSTDLDQSEVMPAVYAKKYNAARRRRPLNVGFDNQLLHIGMHVRRGDVNPLKETNIQQWKFRWVSNTYYLNALKGLLALVDKTPFQVHIFSDGKEGELSDFNQIRNCVFHLNEDSIFTFHGMTSVDILISSSSAFAICAGKISRGIKLISRDFDRDQFRLFVPRTTDWIRIEPTGHLSGYAKRQIRHEVAIRGLLSGDRSQIA
jgi:hypothetical protein